MVRSNSKNFRTNSTKYRNCFENIEQSNYRRWVYDRADELRTTQKRNLYSLKRRRTRKRKILNNFIVEKHFFNFSKYLYIG